eukprot:172842-Pelagomonas_calceolata.AAC.2
MSERGRHVFIDSIHRQALWCPTRSTSSLNHEQQCQLTAPHLLVPGLCRLASSSSAASAALTSSLPALGRLVSTTSESLSAAAAPATKKVAAGSPGKPPLYKEFQLYRCVEQQRLALAMPMFGSDPLCHMPQQVEPRLVRAPQVCFIPGRHQQLWPHDAGRAVQDQGRAGRRPGLQALMPVSAHVMALCARHVCMCARVRA